jgi:quercetin dioxygenase-like cupin family protein
MEPEDMVVIEPEDCEAYSMPEGTLLIGRSDAFASMGFVDLNPGASLPRRSFPASGLFRQISGSSVVRIYREEEVKTERELKAGDSIEVPANSSHSIENTGSGKCLVYWKFMGDVSETFESLRKELPRLPERARKKSGYKELFEEHQKRMEEKQGNY